MDTVPASVDHVLASSGSPLEPALRQDMERRFGHDFSRVRVHSGAAAEQSAQDVNANAYTVGQNIVFGAGRFAPETHEGRRLIAHELAHTIQQSSASKLEYALQLQEPEVRGGWVQRDASRAISPGEFNVPTCYQLYVCGRYSMPEKPGNWQDAAEKLNGFNHIDIQKRLATLTSEEVGRIDFGAIDNPRVGTWPPTSPNSQNQEPHVLRPCHRKNKPRKHHWKKRVPRFVSANYAEVRSDPQYIDNFTNDIKDAWYPNDRVFVFQYPNETFLKFGLSDLLKVLSVPSVFQSDSASAELRKDKDPGGLKATGIDFTDPIYHRW